MKRQLFARCVLVVLALLALLVVIIEFGASNPLARNSPYRIITDDDLRIWVMEGYQDISLNKYGHYYIGLHHGHVLVSRYSCWSDLCSPPYFADVYYPLIKAKDCTASYMKIAQDEWSSWCAPRSYLEASHDRSCRKEFVRLTRPHPNMNSRICGMISCSKKDIRSGNTFVPLNPLMKYRMDDTGAIIATPLQEGDMAFWGDATDFVRRMAKATPSERERFLSEYAASCGR